MTYSSKSLSVFMPFYNEEDLIENVVEDSIEVLENLDQEYELLLINDGSDDSTRKKANSLSNSYSNIRAIHHSENKGYGRALATGFQRSENEIIFYMDGDGQFSIEDIEKFLEKIPEFDLVAGFRKKRDDSFSRKITSKVFNNLTRFLLPIKVKDIDCGSKMVRKEILEDIELNTQRTVDAELLAKSSSEGNTIVEVPVNHFKRDKGESEAEGIFGVRIGLILKSMQELIQIRKEIK